MVGLSRASDGSSDRAVGRSLLTASLLLAVVAVSACSGSDDPESPRGVAPASGSVVPTVPPDPTRTPAVGLQVELIENPDPHRAPSLRLTNAGRQDERLVVRVVPPGAALVRPEQITLAVGRSAEVALEVPPVEPRPAEFTVEVRDLEAGQVLASVEVPVPER